MKKLISLALALMLVFSLATVAMAATYQDSGNTVTMTKKYKLIGSGRSPEETFTFRDVTASKVENAAAGVTTANMPMITVGSVKMNAGAATTDGTDGTVEITVPGVSSDPTTVTLPSGNSRFTVYPSVGVYTYTFSEVNGNVAGVDYYGDTMTVKVSVVQDPNSGLLRVAGIHCENPVQKENKGKTDTFTNTYTAGSLTVTKNVDGALGDRSKAFGFSVIFEAPAGKTVKSDIGVSIAGVEGTAISFKNDDNTYKTTVTRTFSLKHGDSAVFTNIPEGVTYTVTETGAGAPYTTTCTLNSVTKTLTTDNGMTDVISATKDDKGVKTGCDEDKVVFTNTYDPEIDTGITLDSLPFVLILAVCAGAVVLFVIKRRNSVEF